MPAIFGSMGSLSRGPSLALLAGLTLLAISWNNVAEARLPGQAVATGSPRRGVGTGLNFTVGSTGSCNNGEPVWGCEHQSARLCRSYRSRNLPGASVFLLQPATTWRCPIPRSRRQELPTLPRQCAASSPAFSTVRAVCLEEEEFDRAA